MVRSSKARGGSPLSNVSTFLLSAIPQCPGTQMSRTLLKVANAFSAVLYSISYQTLQAETAFMAAKLSEQIAIVQLFLSNKLGSLHI